MAYATTTNAPNRTLYSNFTLFNFVSLMCLWVCLCIRERKERKDIGIDLSRLYQVCLWSESQNVSTADTINKTALHFSHI